MEDTRLVVAAPQAPPTPLIQAPIPVCRVRYNNVPGVSPTSRSTNEIADNVADTTATNITEEVVTSEKTAKQALDLTNDQSDSNSSSTSISGENSSTVEENQNQRNVVATMDDNLEQV